MGYFGDFIALWSSSRLFGYRDRGDYSTRCVSTKNKKINEIEKLNQNNKKKSSNIFFSQQKLTIVFF